MVRSDICPDGPLIGPGVSLLCRGFLAAVYATDTMVSWDLTQACGPDLLDVLEEEDNMADIHWDPKVCASQTMEHLFARGHYGSLPVQKFWDEY